MRTLIIVLALFLSHHNFGFAQEIKRPPVWGIAKMTFLVSDYQQTENYYGYYLGFDKAFTYESPIGIVESYKVNDRQFLEFIEDKDAKNKVRLVSVSLETEDVEQMRLYLQSKGVEVPKETSIDGAGNEIILIHDPYGVPIEFIDLNENSLHRKSTGKFLSDRRISKRLHHVGLYCTEVLDNDSFYVGILGCKELWRYPESKEEKVQMNYLHFPDCIENIEHYPSDDINFNHPCFMVEDMQETIYTLKERKGDQHQLARPIVAKGKRWLLNMKNADGTKVEFTESHIVR